MVKEKVVNYGKEKNSVQELKDTIRKLKMKNRLLEKEVKRLKSELKSSDKGFKKSQERIEELVEDMTLEEAIKGKPETIEDVRARFRKQFSGGNNES